MTAARANSGFRDHARTLSPPHGRRGENRLVFRYCLGIACMNLMIAANPVADAGPLKLWYDKPASEWVQALPIGNGRFGAMVFGGTGEARYQFNDDTLFTGEP